MSLDAVIVGAGPVGLATAILATQRGLRVQVLDARTPGPCDAGGGASVVALDKACGEGLMPGGVERLRAMGVQMPQSGTSPFTGIQWIEGGVVADGAFPHGVGLGVRRIHLHHAMVERAGALDIPIRWGTRATALREDGVETSVGAVHARVVVGADGLRSKVRHWAGLSAGVGRLQRFGVRRHYTLRPWSDRVQVTMGPSSECYVTPVGADRVGVAVLWSGGKGGYDAQMQAFPQVLERLQGAPTESRAQGAGPLNQRAAGVTRGHVALVGDAGGYLDACTGEGMSLGFEQARLLVDAIAADRLDAYATAHRRLIRMPFAMMRLLLLSAQLGLRARLIRGLAVRSQLFGRVLAVNDGAATPTAADLAGLAGALLVP
jgi:flavin-dependent dehydrogenase